MAGPDQRGNYSSGEDFVLETGNLKYTYNETDFAQRAECAARTLDIVDGCLDEGDMQDLVALVVEGAVREPISAFGDHISNHERHIQASGNQPSLVHWLRRIMFRSSWLDQRVKEGELDVVFDPSTGGFNYIQLSLDRDTAGPIKIIESPSWQHITYKPGNGQSPEL